jgi:hypothetical protein
MGFIFRRSVKAGPFRLNFSKFIAGSSEESLKIAAPRP